MFTVFRRPGTMSSFTELGDGSRFPPAAWPGRTLWQCRCFDKYWGRLVESPSARSPGNWEQGGCRRWSALRVKNKGKNKAWIYRAVFKEGVAYMGAHICCLCLAGFCIHYWNYLHEHFNKKALFVTIWIQNLEIKKKKKDQLKPSLDFETNKTKL